MFALFKQLTAFQRKNLLIQLSTNKEEKAKYFKEFYQFFNSNKEKLTVFISKATQIWNGQQVSEKKIEGYFG